MYRGVPTQRSCACGWVAAASAIMDTGDEGSLGHKRKHRNHLTLMEQMIAGQLAIRVGRADFDAASVQLYSSHPTIGDLFAYQYVTDANYSNVTHFPEMEFVVPGPGALNRNRKCFAETGGLCAANIIRVMADRQEIEFTRFASTLKRCGDAGYN